MSSFTWVDFSDEDRERVGAVLQMFSEQETLDEMGIGNVRDGIADLLFPGTSTIQTRARYFLFVPWMYLRHEKKKTSSNEITRRGREDELKLTETLLSSGETIGVIGSHSRRLLKRLPSNIYWAGLKRLGLLKFAGSQDEYHRGFLSGLRTGFSNVDGDDDEAARNVSPNWDPRLPLQPKDFPGKASTSLTREEAEYLALCIDSLEPRPLFSVMIRKMGPANDAPLPWFHPNISSLGEYHSAQLLHARNFSDVFHGTALLYHVMLADLLDKPELIASYREKFSRWAETIVARLPALREWNLARFEQLMGDVAKPDERALRFIDQWLQIVLDEDDTKTLVDNDAVRRLISEREWQTKNKRARLHNRQALGRWKGTIESSQMNYRWHRVRILINDIRLGLGMNI